MTLSAPPGPRREGRAVVVYTAARLGLLIVCIVLGLLAGLTGALLLVVALAVSGALSWFLLQRQRAAMGATVERVITRTRRAVRARTEAEDAYVDSHLPPARDGSAADEPRAADRR